MEKTMGILVKETKEWIPSQGVNSEGFFKVTLEEHPALGKIAVVNRLIVTPGIGLGGTPKRVLKDEEIEIIIQYER